MSDLREALRDLVACYEEARDDMSRAERAHHRKVLVAARAALSAAPAQEMTDAEIIDFMGWHAGAYGNAQEGDLSLKVRDLVRHVEHRASRLPEMGEGDWPELPERNDA